MQPRIFVITVCRNAAATIEDTLCSVLCQQYDRLCYVVIDGASTDGTQDIVGRYADRLAFWSSEPDKGIYDAMNKGLRQCRAMLAPGETAWVNFMNSGDAFADAHVLADVAAALAQAPEAMVVGGDTINYYADGHEETHVADDASALPRRLPFSHQSSLVRIGHGEPLMGRQPWCFDPDYRLAADYHLFYTIYYRYKAAAFVVLHRPLARYRQEDSTSLVNLKRTQGEYLAIQSVHPSWRWVKAYLKWRWL